MPDTWVRDPLGTRTSFGGADPGPTLATVDHLLVMVIHVQYSSKLLLTVSMKMDSAVLWTFSVLILLIGVYGVGADKVPVSVKKGDPVTLNTSVTINQDDTIHWFYNDTRIAEVDKNVRKICTDDLCKEKFRDRLKLDHKTGYLTITDTKTTDSGEYNLEIIGFERNSEKTFTVTVYLSVTDGDKDTKKETSVEEEKSGSGRSQAPVAGIIVGVLLMVAAAAAVGGVMYYLKRRKAGRDVTGSDML